MLTKAGIQRFSGYLLRKMVVMDVVKRKQMSRAYKTDLCFHQLGWRAHVAEFVPKGKRTEKDARTRRLTAIPMKESGGGGFCKGYSLAHERISLAHTL